MPILGFKKHLSRRSSLLEIRKVHTCRTCLFIAFNAKNVNKKMKPVEKEGTKRLASQANKYKIQVKRYLKRRLYYSISLHLCQSYQIFE